MLTHQCINFIWGTSSLLNCEQICTQSNALYLITFNKPNQWRMKEIRVKSEFVLFNDTWSQCLLVGYVYCINLI